MVVSAFVWAAVATVPNMNGEYVYWKTPGAPSDISFPTNFMSYPGGVESVSFFRTVLKCSFFAIKTFSTCYYLVVCSSTRTMGQSTRHILRSQLLYLINLFSSDHLEVLRLPQVWWTQASDDLPEAIVKRFKGKVMAIVGVEMDQVRKTPEGDVSGRTKACGVLV